MNLVASRFPRAMPAITSQGITEGAMADTPPHTSIAKADDVFNQFFVLRPRDRPHVDHALDPVRLQQTNELTHRMRGSRSAQARISNASIGGRTGRNNSN